MNKKLRSIVIINLVLLIAVVLGFGGCATVAIDENPPSFQEMKKDAYLAGSVWGNLGHNGIRSYADYAYFRRVAPIEVRRAKETGQVFLDAYHRSVDLAVAYVRSEGLDPRPLDIALDQMAVAGSDIMWLISGYVLDEAVEVGVSPEMSTVRMALIGVRLGMRFGIPAVGAVYRSATNKDPTVEDFIKLHDLMGYEIEEYFY